MIDYAKAAAKLNCNGFVSEEAIGSRSFDQDFDEFQKQVKRHGYSGGPLRTYARESDWSYFAYDSDRYDKALEREMDCAD